MNESLTDLEEHDGE